MPTSFYAAQIYPQFKSEIDKLELWLLSITPSFGQYSSQAFTKRLTQRVVEIGLVPYVELYAANFEQQSLISNTENLEFGSLKFNRKSGALSLSLRLFLQSVLEFHVHWLHALFQVVMGLLKKSEPKGSASIVFGVGIENIFVEDTDLRFIEYCRFGAIDPLRQSKRLIVQAVTNSQSTNASYLEYSRFPLFALMLGNPLKFSAFSRFFLQHFKMVLAYWLAIIRFPLVSLLGRDFAYHAIADDLNDRNLIESIIITNSNYSAQPLWMSDLPKKNFKTHMVWYAQNTVPIAYKNNPIKASIPNYYYMQVDTHWVWTKGYAEYLISLGIKSEIKVVGPIVWHLAPESLQKKNKSNEVVISVFDVTPVNNDFAEKIGLYNNYYSPSNVLDFIKKIEKLKSELEKNNIKVRILLKHKRYYNAAHAKEYVSYVAQAAQDGTIELVDTQLNIFSIVASSDLVVVVPYSSPVYVADSLAVPAIFYDTTETVFPVYEKTDYVHFASGYEELISLSKKILNVNASLSIQIGVG